MFESIHQIQNAKRYAMRSARGFAWNANHLDKDTIRKAICLLKMQCAKHIALHKILKAIRVIQYSMRFASLREGLARAQEEGGPECRPQWPLPAERVGRAGEAPHGRTPSVARAPREVKIPKPQQRLAVGGTHRCQCSVPYSTRGGSEQWTTCQSEC